MDEALTFQSTSNVYGLSIQNFTNINNQDNPLIAISSIEIEEDIKNSFSILSIDEIDETFVMSERVNIRDLNFPLSKISFNELDPTLLATSDIELTIYSINRVNNEYEFKKELSLAQNELYPAPLTSFDWNKTNKALIIASSYDTTCTVWDLNTSQVLTRLIAHDKEVYDVGFLEGEHSFVSAGAEGELRMFDLRDLDNSQIVFDSKDRSALTRMSICSIDTNYIIALSSSKPYFYLIDLRDISSPVAIIQSHTNLINAAHWSKYERGRFATAGDDKSLLVWDLKNVNTQKPNYIFSEEEYEINNIDCNGGLLAYNCNNLTKVYGI